MNSVYIIVTFLTIIGTIHQWSFAAAVKTEDELLLFSRTKANLRNYLLEKQKYKFDKEIETNSIISSEEQQETEGGDDNDDKDADESNNNLLEQPNLENMWSAKRLQVKHPSKHAPASYKPIVIWHGMGDNAVGIKFALSFIAKEMPGVYIKSLQIGSNPAKDTENGFFMNVNDQVAFVCETIKNDSKLSNGYNAIGISQGGQFLRAVAQRCPEPRINNLISIGGQHQGVFGLPQCSAPKQEWCEIIDKLLSHAAYAEWVQKFLVQAEYWHDPFKANEYIQHSVFLADINNERVKNETYKQNLLKLTNLVLLKFNGDTIVQPKETEWFGYFVDGQDKIMYKLEDSPLYKEDWLGLKQLNDSGRLHFLSVPGNHLIFTKDWFIQNILKPFLL